MHRDVHVVVRDISPLTHVHFQIFAPRPPLCHHGSQPAPQSACYHVHGRACGHVCAHVVFIYTNMCAELHGRLFRLACRHVHRHGCACRVCRFSPTGASEFAGSDTKGFRRTAVIMTVEKQLGKCVQCVTTSAPFPPAGLGRYMAILLIRKAVCRVIRQIIYASDPPDHVYTLVLCHKVYLIYSASWRAPS